jgi:hypothetical protein
MGAITFKYGEIFHQDISQMERRCSGNWNTNIMLNVAVDKNETPTDEYKRQRSRIILMTKLFSEDNLYTDIPLSLTIYIVVKKQNYTFAIKNPVFKFNPSPLKLVVHWAIF